MSERCRDDTLTPMGPCKPDRLRPRSFPTKLRPAMGYPQPWQCPSPTRQRYEIVEVEKLNLLQTMLDRDHGHALSEPRLRSDHVSVMTNPFLDAVLFSIIGPLLTKNEMSEFFADWNHEATYRASKAVCGEPPDRHVQNLTSATHFLNRDYALTMFLSRRIRSSTPCYRAPTTPTLNHFLLKMKCQSFLPTETMRQRNVVDLQIDMCKTWHQW